MALKSGETVSTSEAAKQLLESARDDRLELVNLLTEPTDSLLRIRGKADSDSRFRRRNGPWWPITVRRVQSPL